MEDLTRCFEEADRVKNTKKGGWQYRKSVPAGITVSKKGSIYFNQELLKVLVDADLVSPSEKTTIYVEFAVNTDYVMAKIKANGTSEWAHAVTFKVVEGKLIGRKVVNARMAVKLKMDLDKAKQEGNKKPLVLPLRKTQLGPPAIFMFRRP